jgi:hypothetical protein
MPLSASHVLKSIAIWSAYHPIATDERTSRMVSSVPKPTHAPQQTLVPFGRQIGKGSAPKCATLGAQMAFIGGRDAKCIDRKRPTR